ncbi:MAG TPA: archaellin/type IV pilin N-terminal domain-containing protein [Thermoplasmata archaeon]|nr:archaellin/type IV pilin N-terminal domain-containing protein [Thermoplasmata archaeon]
MRRVRRWRRHRRRAISEIIAAVLLIALTLVAGVLLWSLRIYTPPAPPSITVSLRSGGSNPVWGDPTDCQPYGYSLHSYPLSGSGTTGQSGAWRTAWSNQCASPNVSGNFSALNTTQFVIASHSPAIIPLSDLNLTFVCNGHYAPAPYTTINNTILVQGTLDSMTWFPGSTTSPAPNAPHLGWCGGFHAAGYLGGAFGVLYNRLALFDPLKPGIPYLENGDTFLLYIHNGGWPLDFYCVLIQTGLFGGNTVDCPLWSPGASPSTYAYPVMDHDDYHGAPPWCFTNINACTIYIEYTGTPVTQVASISVYSLAPGGA